MVNFEKIDEMINIIAGGDIPESQSFNEFAINFYLETKIVPLSKYLKMEGKTNKMPKIMNTKKGGELLFHTKKNEEILKFLKKRGYSDIPEVDMRIISITYQRVLNDDIVTITFTTDQSFDNLKLLARYISNDSIQTQQQVINDTVKGLANLSIGKVTAIDGNIATVELERSGNEVKARILT